MNSLDTHQKRLQEQVGAVENEIELRKEQIEALNRRLESLKRATELLDSEQEAMLELLRTSSGDEGLSGKDALPTPAANRRNGRGNRSVPVSQRKEGAAVNGRATAQKAKRGRGLSAGRPERGLKRIDMIAAVLKRHPRLSVHELLAALENEFGWKSTESSVTGHLYTNQKRFMHTKPDQFDE
jgi:hypothetical protein